MSNRYIFTYATLMIVIVAALLSTAATVLKPYQQANIRAAKMVDILKSFGVESNRDQADINFNKYIEDEMAVSATGELISLYKKGEKISGGDIRPFEFDLKKQLKKHSSGEEASFPVYKAKKDNKTFYVIPLHGKGLWGPIWGYIALKDDLKTVFGVTFAHKAETPGLGAEIDKPAFQNLFQGKQIWNDKDEFTPIDVVKGSITNLPQAKQGHSVDGISGGTLTGNGVDAMINDVLIVYKGFIVKERSK